MNELEQKKKTTMEFLNVEVLPVVLNEQIDINKSTKIPLEKVKALGVAFEPIASIYQMVVGDEAGTSGLYYANTKGLSMAQFKDGSGFLGSLLTESGTVGGGQAVLTQMPCNPEMLFMAASLMSIEEKLDDIKELQKDILDYMKAQEKAKILGDINVLTDVLNNYKFNCENEKYKTNKHILVQDIRKDAEQNLLLCRDQIERELGKNIKTIHRDDEVKKKVEIIKDGFNDYQQSLFLYSYSAFLEIMLLENFSSDYLESVINRINEYSANYNNLYESCYNVLEKSSKSSVQSYLTKGAATISKSAGETIAKIPVVSKGKADETLVLAGDKIEEFSTRKTEKTLKPISEDGSKYTTPFIANIININKIYNEPREIVFDSKYIYLLNG